MTEIKPPAMPDSTPASSRPLRKTSGEHAAVKEMRAKFESIAEHTVPVVEALNTRVEELGNAVSSHPPTPSEEEIVPDTEPECLCNRSQDEGMCPIHHPNGESS